ncbi:MAG: immunoglobulin-like domain-containing protein [Culicoidibacterales bacterium]
MMNKKILCTVLSIMLLVSNLPLPVLVAKAEEEIGLFQEEKGTIANIPDDNFRRELNLLLKQPEDAIITIEQLHTVQGNSMSGYDLRNRGIKDITGIEHLVNINRGMFNLMSNHITDLTQLLTLPNLTKVAMTSQTVISETTIVIKSGTPMIEVENPVKGINLTVDEQMLVLDTENLQEGIITDVTANFTKRIATPSGGDLSYGLTFTQPVYVDEKPEIHGATDVTIKIDDLFDPMDSVSVTDKEDDVTGTAVNVVVTGDVDTTKAGKYVVTYTATDSVGNVTTVERIITVNEQMSGMNSIPTITLINPELTLKQDEVFDALAWATATDAEDGDLTAEIEVVKNTVNPSMSEMYEVTYKVTDSFGASTTATMSVYVDEKPEIHGATDLTIKVGETFDPMNGVSATDKEAGDITAEIKVEGNVDAITPGKYTLRYSVDDEFFYSPPARIVGSGNVTTVERIITVNGEMNGMNNIPTITLINSELTLKQDEGFDALAWATAADEEDGDLTAKIEVVKNTVNPAVSAMYEVTYKVTDSFGASTTATMSVYIDEKPEIHGATDLTIKVGEAFDPMNGITVSDKEDDATGTVVKLVVTSDVDTTKAGKYVVTYTATDSIGNNSTVIREISVVATNTEEPLLPETPESGSETTKPLGDNELAQRLPTTGNSMLEITVILGLSLTIISVIVLRRNGV